MSIFFTSFVNYTSREFLMPRHLVCSKLFSQNKKNKKDSTTLTNAVPFDPSKDQPTVTDVVKNLELRELWLGNIAKLPCAKNALLYGISGGLTVSLARFLARKNLRSAGNWGILAFSAIAVASWETCRLQRRLVQEQLSQLAVEQQRQQLEQPQK
ncbi:hypothetical protein BCR33DRAFT_518348 [Rhizoclosmatium globosum]|uniref:Cytochrome c oxidase assembly protein COX20, mitochondrial n=1 Tax=Rhizoclosmatium globosum TaxID=329046 RepID=A0A1Y2BFF0_9FUNG|nr:hypothetical protein BCR33DRAFT_518348 [Rhizoclosmatium globosum]|eukprot:ORY33534.1 hypothetical protein BCR33DRAFT_518348 [Rhizoclosmatium globosum]